MDPRSGPTARPSRPGNSARGPALWWFCDGAIMDGGTREHLWRSWGLCPRHAWLYFRAENELKYQPLGNAVLFEDLTGRVVSRLRSHRGERHKRHALATRDTCLTCDYVRAQPPQTRGSTPVETGSLPAS